MKVVVAGSRTFSDLQLMTEKLDKILFRVALTEPIIIVSGAARGADKLGEKYAKLRGYAVERFPADWDNFGKSAGYRRNEQMGDYADALVAFWDGESKGTAHMIDVMVAMNKPVRVIKFKRS